MKTKRGIFLDIMESNYCFTFNDLKFYFSSELYFNKFKERIDSFILNENNKLKTRYKVNCDLTLYLAISLYKKIEKRGFNVMYLDKEINKFIEIKENITIKDVIKWQ